MRNISRICKCEKPKLKQYVDSCIPEILDVNTNTYIENPIFFDIEFHIHCILCGTKEKANVLTFKHREDIGWEN